MLRNERKVAAEYEAEAERIKIVAKARAEAESKRLQGQGIADQRREIARGLGRICRCVKQCWNQFSRSFSFNCCNTTL